MGGESHDRKQINIEDERAKDLSSLTHRASSLQFQSPDACRGHVNESKRDNFTLEQTCPNVSIFSKCATKSPGKNLRDTVERDTVEHPRRPWQPLRVHVQQGTGRL